MIAEVVESLAGLVEFAIEALAIPSRRSEARPRVGDRVRATRVLTLPAVLRPVTPQADRLQVLVPAGSRWRVELALPVRDRAVYLACLDPLDGLGLTRSERDRALVTGLWLEIPRPLFAEAFRPL